MQIPSKSNLEKYDPLANIPEGVVSSVITCMVNQRPLGFPDSGISSTISALSAATIARLIIFTSGSSISTEKQKKDLTPERLTGSCVGGKVRTVRLKLAVKITVKDSCDNPSFLGTSPPIGGKSNKIEDPWKLHRREPTPSKQPRENLGSKRATYEEMVCILLISITKGTHWGRNNNVSLKKGICRRDSSAAGTPNKAHNFGRDKMVPNSRIRSRKSEILIEKEPEVPNIKTAIWRELRYPFIRPV
ncbi:hypothetical protein LXL04_031017 [Taraxacum kok-saghyz]